MKQKKIFSLSLLKKSILIIMNLFIKISKILKIHLIQQIFIKTLNKLLKKEKLSYNQMLINIRLILINSNRIIIIMMEFIMNRMNMIRENKIESIIKLSNNSFKTRVIFKINPNCGARLNKVKFQQVINHFPLNKRYNSLVSNYIQR